MRNIFLETLCTECGGENNPRLFYKKSKFGMFLDQQSEVTYNLFLFPSRGLLVETKVLTTCF